MINSNFLNKIQYEIQSDAMRKFFAVDNYGSFKIVVPQLTTSDSPNRDGIFEVEIQLTDSNNCFSLVKVTVQLSQIINKNRCPQISDKALCHFSINKTDFDANRIRFCFYGTTKPSFNLNPNSNPNEFANKLYYSLLPNSPDYLYMNPYDGCIKIAPVFNLNASLLKHIQYSVGVFNPGYPDCMYSNQRQCLINILNPNIQQLKCVNDFSVSTNSTFFQLKVHIPNINSKLYFRILNEERIVDTNGQSDSYTNNYFYKVNPITGILESDFSQANIHYSSILVTVEVNDMFQLSSPTKCN